jgi:hypothetical protein
MKSTPASSSSRNCSASASALLSRVTYEELGTQTDEPVESPEDPSQKQAFLKLQIK